MARAAAKTTRGKAAAKKKAHRGGAKGRKWTWGHVNIFITDTKKWHKDARIKLPGSKHTVRGVVFRAMQQLKKGSDDTVIALCEKMGIKHLTKQNARKQVQMKLRRLRRWGVITRAKHTKKAKRASAVARQPKPVTKPVKATPPPARPKPPVKKAKPPIGQPKAPAAPKKRPTPKPKPVAPVPTPPPPPEPVFPEQPEIMEQSET